MTGIFLKDPNDYELMNRCLVELGFIFSETNIETSNYYEIYLDERQLYTIHNNGMRKVVTFENLLWEYGITNGEYNETYKRLLKEDQLKKRSDVINKLINQHKVLGNG